MILQVDEATIRAWILYAAVEEDPLYKQFQEEIGKIDVILAGIDNNMLKVPKLEFLDDEGKPYPVERARAERENLYNVLSNQRVMAEDDKEVAQRNLANHVDWRNSMGVELTKGVEDKNTDTRTWFVRFYGTEDAKQIEDSLIEKEDWPGINLACGMPDADPPVKPWVGRDKTVPDGSKANATTDYSPLQVLYKHYKLLKLYLPVTATLEHFVILFLHVLYTLGKYCQCKNSSNSRRRWYDSAVGPLQLQYLFRRVRFILWNL